MMIIGEQVGRSSWYDSFRSKVKFMTPLRPCKTFYLTARDDVCWVPFLPFWKLKRRRVLQLLFKVILRQKY